MLDIIFFNQAKEGKRDLVRFRGLGDMNKRNPPNQAINARHKCITSGILSLLSKIEAPVVVKDDSISKYASKKLIFITK